MAKKLSDDDLLIMSHTLLQEGESYLNEEIAINRAQAMRYYRGENPDGMPLIEGRSQMVDTQFRDTLEWIMPDLVRIFAGDDEIVSIEPHGEEDTFDADTAQDWVNYVIMRQNRGFLNTYTWIKDALMLKLGFLKQFWKTEEHRIRRDYEGLTDDELEFLQRAEDFEIADTVSTEMVSVILPDGNEGLVPADSEIPGKPLLNEEGEVELLSIHDVSGYEIIEDHKICEEVLAPENVIFLEDTIEIPWKCRLIAHSVEKRVAELREMFPDVDIPDDIQGWKISDDGHSLEDLERYYETGEFPYDQDDSLIKDPSQRKVWMYETYMLCDRDGDGREEWVQLFRVGDTLLSIDEVDYPHIFTICPILWPHRAVGFSLFDLLKDLQELQTALHRQILDYVYSVNNPRVNIAMDFANEDTIDDYLDNRVGGYIRSAQPGAVTPVQTQPMQTWVFNLLELWEQKRESRTGVSRLSGGLDPNALNQTATGVVQILNQAARRIELIARIFAETGFRDRVKGILDLSAQYPDYTQGQILRLTGRETQALDARKLIGRYDLIVNAGVGSSVKDQQAQHMMTLLNTYERLTVAGLGPGSELQLVTVKNIFNAVRDMITGFGRRNTADYITDPDDQNADRDPPKEQQPSKEQLDFQIKQKELALDEQKQQQEFEVKMRELALKEREVNVKEREVAAKEFAAGRERARSSEDRQTGGEQDQGGPRPAVAR